jgi:hypothetical protein
LITIVPPISVQHCHHRDIHELPLCASILGYNHHFLKLKLVFPLSLLGINFVLMLSLLILMLPLLRLNPILMHHHAHHIFEREAAILTVVNIL